MENDVNLSVANLGRRVAGNFQGRLVVGHRPEHSRTIVEYTGSQISYFYGTLYHMWDRCLEFEKKGRLGSYSTGCCRFNRLYRFATGIPQYNRQ